MNRINVMNKFERVIFFALSIFLIFTTAFFLKLNYFSQSTDTAGMVDLIGNIAAGKGMVSPTFTSFYSAWILLVKTPELYCQGAFDSLFVDANFARWHPYLIAYPMAALTWLPGIDNFDVTVLGLAASLTGGLAAAYWFLRRQGVSVGLAVLFVAVVFLFQPWAGNLVGQFYFDRLFFLPALILVFTVHERLTTGRGNWTPIVLSAVICFLISERSAIMGGAFLSPIPSFGSRRYGVRATPVFSSAWGLAASSISPCTRISCRTAGITTSIGLGSVICWLHRGFRGGRPHAAANRKVDRDGAADGGIVDIQLAGFSSDHRSAPAELSWSRSAARRKTGVTTHYHMPYLPFMVAGAAIGVGGLGQLREKGRGNSVDGGGRR